VKSISRRSFPSVLFAVIIAGSATSIFAQSTAAQIQRPAPKPTVVMPTETAPVSVAKEKELVCGGYMKVDPPNVSMQLVGGEQEQEQHQFFQGNNVFLNAGRQQGIEQGLEFAVVRPRGNFRSNWSKRSSWSKKGSLGVYTQEIGRVRVIRVKDNVSVALVTTSCDAMLLGDLIVPVPRLDGPIVKLADHIDLFADPTGKQTGRIVYTREGQEMVSVNQVVYIDLGTQDNIKSGDIFTIYRPSDTPRMVVKNEEEIIRNIHDGFQSDKFKGETLSMDAPRTRDQNSFSVDLAPNVTTTEIKKNRPEVPRKVVGELVVTNVQQRTATAVITRVAQEVHTGDFVEMQ
jgi:hypothetical protein